MSDPLRSGPARAKPGPKPLITKEQRERLLAAAAKATRRTEYDEAKDLSDWLRRKGYLFLHIPNEGVRSRAHAAALKATGMRKGAPDYLIFERCSYPGHGIALELKREDAPAPPAEQLWWQAELKKRGWIASVCYGAKAAIQWLTELGL